MPEQRITIDLNSDMGEGFSAYRLAPDEDLLRLVTSANVACGFHAGDPRVMDRTVAVAAANGVTIGAHVSYPDLVGFGRRPMKISPAELVTDTLYQVGALDAFCRRHGTSVKYVKAHGALYNDLAHDPALAAGLADAVRAYDEELAVLVLAGSPAVAVMQEKGVPVHREAFADRAYTPDGRLVSRSLPGAVLSDADAVADRTVRIATGKPIDDSEGRALIVEADSVCVHSDTPGAVELAMALRAALQREGVQVRSFA